jgi:hypothetical protein
MIDNWTLQDVNNILSDGLDTQTADELTLSPGRRRHTFSAVPAGVFQIDALITLLTNVVCFDSLTVDRAFIDTWQGDDAALLPLASLGIVTATDYSVLGANWSPCGRRLLMSSV